MDPDGGLILVAFLINPAEVVREYAAQALLPAIVAAEDLERAMASCRAPNRWPGNSPARCWPWLLIGLLGGDAHWRDGCGALVTLLAPGIGREAALHAPCLPAAAVCAALTVHALVRLRFD